MQPTNPQRKCGCLLGAAPAQGSSAHAASQGYSTGAGVAWEQRPEWELLFGFGFLKARVGGGCGREVGRQMTMRWNEGMTREAAAWCLGGISACAWCSPALRLGNPEVK